MEKFEKLTAIAAPMPLINIDTDMIIPKQFLKTIKRSGLGVSAFHEMRYNLDGSDNPDFVLNKDAYKAPIFWLPVTISVVAPHANMRLGLCSILASAA